VASSPGFFTKRRSQFAELRVVRGQEFQIYPKIDSGGEGQKASASPVKYGSDANRLSGLSVDSFAYVANRALKDVLDL
jgi:hypothetical protein